MKSFSGTRVMFFDAADTLFHVKGSVGEVYLSHARKYGVTAGREVIQQAFAKAFADAPPPVFAASDPQEIKSCERMWWFDVVHNVFYRVGMFEGFDEYFDDVFAYFSRPESWELYPDAMPALRALEARGIELGIISNFDSRLYEILVGLGIDRFFESVTISSFAGAAKPSSKIFQRALHKHGVEASGAVHVGNSLREDAQAAVAAGLGGVFLDRERNVEHRPDVVTIRSLSELVTLR
ncbi:MAG: HAD family hydrolase [Nitrospirae bacterium]|nr:MAG: HAD family hydrolase [Nitrospirota bacterium]